ncbi:MAG TPA: MFS transporter [Caulobacteraceae bacterium]|nr:MFS transporter [Caulobacteraceae bacterium]
MDVQIYALVMPAIMAVWGLTKGQAGLLGTLALLASSVGGILAGYLADRLGRVRVLQISIVWFSAFTFLSGLAQNYEMLMAFRVLQGVGFGGEWAAGAVLVAEIVGAKHRGKAVAVVSSGWAVGYGLAAILFTLLFNLMSPAIAWRALFFVGVLPAILIVYIQRFVDDSAVFLAARKDREKTEKLNPLEIFKGRLGLRTLVAWLICLGVLGGNYTVLTWLPTYLQKERGLSISNTGLFLLVNIAGSFVGYILGGHVSDRLGRRNALKLYAILGAMSVYAYVLFASSGTAVLIMGFFLGFAQSGMNSGLGPLLSELFPTRVRATGQGFCYNAGRGLGAIFPAIVGWWSTNVSLTFAISVTAACAYALVFVFSFLLPETKAAQLSSVGLSDT